MGVFWANERDFIRTSKMLNGEANEGDYGKHSAQAQNTHRFRPGGGRNCRESGGMKFPNLKFMGASQKVFKIRPL